MVLLWGLGWLSDCGNEATGPCVTPRQCPGFWRMSGVHKASFYGLNHVHPKFISGSPHPSTSECGLI